MRWALVVIVALAGCNQLLGLKDVIPTDAGETTTPCAALKFDPARYRSAVSSSGFTWQTARDACRFQGYDLAVLDKDDPIELGNEANGAMLPFWLGVSYAADWQATDGCAPELDWAPSEPNTSMVGECVTQSALGMRSEMCTRSMTAGSMINVLCETPRPSVHCLRVQDERNYMMVPGNVNHVDAETACSALGMHILEINSGDELAYVLGHFPGTPTFWLGAAKGGGTFTSPTGCPQAWAWGPNDPDMTSSCVAYAQGAMESYDCNTAAPGIICETNSAI